MSKQPHILIIDNTPQTLSFLRTVLSQKQFRVTTTQSGHEGLALAAADLPDLILLELLLPDLDGLLVCNRLREWTQTPIIVLSALQSEQVKIDALDQGADDYLTKPFGVEELLARIRVALRRTMPSPVPSNPIISSGDLVINLTEHRVTKSGQEVKLTAMEFQLLAYLALNAGRVLTHQNILRHVWGTGDEDRVTYLRVYIRQLRKKLETDPNHPLYFLTEPGIGYRLWIDK